MVLRTGVASEKPVPVTGALDGRHTLLRPRGADHALVSACRQRHEYRQRPEEDAKTAPTPSVMASWHRDLAPDRAVGDGSTMRNRIMISGWPAAVPGPHRKIALSRPHDAGATASGGSVTATTDMSM